MFVRTIHLLCVILTSASAADWGDGMSVMLRDAVHESSHVGSAISSIQAFKHITRPPVLDGLLHSNL